MRVYHCSNSNFTKLKIGKSLVKRNSTLTNEGYGIYFSSYKDVAKSYGRYIYTLDINNDYFEDFTNLNTCRKYLHSLRRQIYNRFNVDIAKYIDLDNVAKYVKYGNIAVSGICREVYLLLDSCVEWYQLPQSKISRIYSMLNVYDSKHLYAYSFTYNIKGIGVIKNVSDDVVRIVSKDKLW